MRKLMLALLVPAFMGVATAATIVDEPNYKSVGNVRWQKVETVDVETLSQRAVPYGEASLFFVRENNPASAQTSVNIAINDRFQVSLQPGNFSQVNSCSGLNDISADITGNKSNNLLYNARRFDLQSQGAYFFLVSVDARGNASVDPVPHNAALQYIRDNNLQYQSHQISRVVKDVCEQRIAPMPVVRQPAPVRPVAKEPVSINLEVLFDTDKAFVKPKYYAEIGKVAAFMQKHPNVTAVIEGHADSRADDAHNLALSQRRVDAVRLILINEHKIDPQRLASIGYGERRPIADNSTPEGRKKNRRVVATFSGL